jgi:acetyltransferase-like isoleucine patch superfamily enzyme
VGAGAVILGPVKVGSNSVIGANAVVTKDVPENVIVGGVPAQIIKDKWDESTGRKY